MNEDLHTKLSDIKPDKSRFFRISLKAANYFASNASRFRFIAYSSFKIKGTCCESFPPLRLAIDSHSFITEARLVLDCERATNRFDLDRSCFETYEIVFEGKLPFFFISKENEYALIGAAKGRI